MSVSTGALRVSAAAIAAALAFAPTSAPAAADPGLSVGTGCAAQCIKKALVTVTSTTAKVQIETTVSAHLTVSVTKHTSSTTSGGLAANVTKTVHISAFAPTKTAWFHGLLPDTKYTIVVKAVDLKKQVARQTGSLKTRAVKAKDHGGPTGFDSGLGCAAQCISTALFTQAPPSSSIANVDIRTATDARIQVIVSRDKPTTTAAGPAQYDVVSNQLSSGYTRSWKTQIGGLRPSSKYYAVVRAKDKQGRIAIRSGSFQTVKATAVVTFHKLKVVSDGDKGKLNKGELAFRYYVDGVEKAWSGGFQKIKSGSVVNAKAAGMSGPGVTFRLPIPLNGNLRLGVVGEECDSIRKNCVLEAFGPSGQYAWAAGTVNVWKTIDSAALPGWYGTGVNPPAGHDGHFVLATGDTYVGFYALATIDVEIDWP